MSRWHESYCSRPEVTIVGGLPCCSYCYALASTEDVALSSRLQRLEIPVAQENTPMNLTLPQSVNYESWRPDGSSTSVPDLGNNNVENTNGSPVFSPPNVDDTCPVGSRGGTPGFGRWRSDPGYSKFDNAQEIRVLVLDPGYQGECVHAEFVNRRFSDDGPCYEAVSYTWADEHGDNTRCRPDFVGIYWDVYLVTRNCEEALLSIRDQFETRNLWVDSLCINQDDMAERSSQVNLMPQIYAEADRVLLYVGQASADTDDAFHRLARQHYFNILIPPS
jgi:hypothetical protein